MGMTKDKLVAIFADMDLYDNEPDAIEAWVAAWREFFENALAIYNQGDPSYVTDQTTTLKIGVNSILGSGDASGVYIRVKCSLTDVEETCISEWDTANYITTSDLLGQEEPPSTTVGDYEVTDTTVIDTALGTPETEMESEMEGLSDDGEAADKIQAGIEAWWDELVANPGTYFSGATSITAPSGLSGIGDDLKATFDENIDAEPALTKKEAYDNIADDLIAANSGGTVTINSVTKDIE